MTAARDDRGPLPRVVAVTGDERPLPACRRYIARRQRWHTARVVALWFIGLAVVASLATGLSRAIDKTNAAVRQLQVVDRRTRPFDPFRPALVRVENRIDGTPGPALVRGAPILVAAPTTNLAPTKVKGLLVLTWQAVDAHGVPLIGQAQTTLASYRTARPPGRSVLHLTLTMPATVRDIDVDLTREHVAHRWELDGRLTPLRANGTAGTGRDFNSEPFRILDA